MSAESRENAAPADHAGEGCVSRPRRFTLSEASITVAAYIRVSSKAQDYAMQRVAIERAAAARGDVVHVWYSEKTSARGLDRPELALLRGDVQAGRFRRLYVFRLDRLTRSGIRDTLDLVEHFRRAGCELVTVADGFDLGGPAGEVILAVMAWAAKMERRAINERIAAARIRLEAEGRPWGRPPRPLSSTERRWILDLVDEGYSVRGIARRRGLSRRTVARVLEEDTDLRAVKAAQAGPKSSADAGDAGIGKSETSAGLPKPAR